MNRWTTSTQPAPGPGSPTLQVSQTDPILLWEALALTGADAAAWALAQPSSILVLNRAPCYPPTFPLRLSPCSLSLVQTLSSMAGMD